MRYRTLGKAICQQMATDFVAGRHVSIDARAGSEGSGTDVDEQSLTEILDQYRTELESNSPKDNELFEGRLAAALFGWFDSLPIEVLDDPGFWRYVSLRHFWWFIEWREAEPIAKGNFNNLVDATLPAEHIPLRLYLRAKAVAEGEDASLAGEIPKSTDFWRSHITRVRVASAPAMARAFAEMKRDEKALDSPLKTERLRRVAKRVNRMWSNVRLDMYDSVESKELMKEIVENEP